MRARAGSSSLKRPARLLAAILPLLSAGACFRVATEPESFCSPYRGSAPLTVRGAAPGQTEAEVVALLGPPDRRGGAAYGAESLQWQRFPDFAVTLDARTGLVTEALGNELTAGGDAVLSQGMSEADVRTVLGKPSESRGHYRPRGSGVISLGSERIGVSLTYRRDGREIEVALNGGALAYVRMKPAS